MQNLSDTFLTEYNTFVSSLPVEEPRDTSCQPMLNEYNKLTTELYTLQEHLSRGQPILLKSLETLLDAPTKINKVSEVEDGCFWFEDYFWWRGKKQFVCSPGSAASKHRARKDRYASASYHDSYYDSYPHGPRGPSGPRDPFPGPTTPPYGFDESLDIHRPLNLLMETSFRLTEKYCQFDILTGDGQIEGIPSFWDRIQCIIAPPTTPIIVAPPPSPTGLPGPSGPRTPAPTMAPAPDPNDPDGNGFPESGKLQKGSQNSSPWGTVSLSVTQLPLWSYIGATLEGGPVLLLSIHV